MGAMRKTMDWFEEIAKAIEESESGVNEVVKNHKMGYLPFHDAYASLIESFDLDPEVALHLLHPPLTDKDWNEEE